jgi:hypothetical protein
MFNEVGKAGTLYFFFFGGGAVARGGKKNPTKPPEKSPCQEKNTQKKRGGRGGLSDVFPLFLFVFFAVSLHGEFKNTKHIPPKKISNTSKNLKKGQVGTSFSPSFSSSFLFSSAPLAPRAGLGGWWLKGQRRYL